MVKHDRLDQNYPLCSHSNDFDSENVVRAHHGHIMGTPYNNGDNYLLSMPEIVSHCSYWVFVHEHVRHLSFAILIAFESSSIIVPSFLL